MLREFNSNRERVKEGRERRKGGMGGELKSDENSQEIIRQFFESFSRFFGSFVVFSQVSRKKKWNSLTKYNPLSSDSTFIYFLVHLSFFFNFIIFQTTYAPLKKKKKSLFFEIKGASTCGNPNPHASPSAKICMQYEILSR